MKLTQAHLQFWHDKRGHPAWARRIKGRLPVPAANVDYLINLQLPLYQGTYLDASNTLSILRSVRRREGNLGVRTWLLSMANNPGTVIRPERRAAYCRKWLKQLTVKEN